MANNESNSTNMCEFISKEMQKGDLKRTCERFKIESRSNLSAIIHGHRQISDRYVDAIIWMHDRMKTRKMKMNKIKGL